MAPKLFLLFAMSLTLVAGQRPGFAGSKPIGYPEVYNRTTTPAAGLVDRFGEGDVTTQRLPIEANGDRDLIDRLSKLPVDKQPFWFINWQALEANRKKPQTYPQKPNNFVDPIQIPNPGSTNTNSITVPNLNTPNSNTESSVEKTSTEMNQAAKNGSDSNTELKNRFSETESKNKGLTEIGSSETITHHTTLQPPSSSSKPVHLPTHNHFSPPWLTTRFKPRNPIID